MVPCNGKWDLPGIKDPDDIISARLKHDVIISPNNMCVDSLAYSPLTLSSQYKKQEPENDIPNTLDEPTVEAERYILLKLRIFSFCFIQLFFVHP